MVASADTGDSALNGFDSRLRFPAEWLEMRCVTRLSFIIKIAAVAPWRFLTVQSKTMTVEQLVKDGQLQVESLKAVVSKDGMRLNRPGIVLVADGDSTMALHCIAGCEPGTWGSVLWPMVGCALAELLKRAKEHDAEAWAVVARYFVLSQDEEEAHVKTVRVQASAKEFEALLAALEGKEVVSDEQ